MKIFVNRREWAIKEYMGGLFLQYKKECR